MFAYIKGFLTHASPLFAIIEAQGVGYKIFIPSNLFEKLPQINAPLLLHTAFIVRELSQSLYGFLSIEERDLFEELLNVTGIGPKLALSIIGHLEISELHAAISSKNIVLLTKVPGIGKKTAERLIIEMRDKIGDLLPAMPLDITLSNQAFAQKVQDAMSALINLGYNQGIAQKALKKSLQEHSEEMELPELIAASLKYTQ